MSKLLKKQQDELNKFSKKYEKKDTDLEDLIKQLDEQNKLAKELDEQNKLSKQQYEQNEILKKQKHELNKLLEDTKDEQEEEYIDPDKLNKLLRKAKNIKSKSPINLRTFAPRRDPFDDINKKKLTPSPSKTSAPIPKSREPQGVAVGEQAGIAIMKNELETSKKYIEYLKKELDKKEF